MDGWIKLHRKLLVSNVFDNEKLLKVFIYCLLKASHDGHNQQVGRQVVPLKLGQFVFGRKKAAAELNMKESTVRDYMNILKDDGVIDIKSTNKYSIVTIENWAFYQTSDDKNRQQTQHQIDTKSTSDEHQINTNKNVKNVENEKNISATAAEKKYGWYDKFHHCFGKVPTPIQIDSITSFLDDGVEEDLLILALEKAGMKNATFRYSETILSEWVAKGIRTIEQGKEESKKFGVIKGGKPDGQNARNSSKAKNESITGGKVGRLIDPGNVVNLDDEDFF